MTEEKHVTILLTYHAPEPRTVTIAEAEAWFEQAGDISRAAYAAAERERKP
jgi:hypothetical protein